MPLCPYALMPLCPYALMRTSGLLSGSRSNAGAFRQRLELGPDDFSFLTGCGRALRETAVRAGNDVLRTYEAGVALDALGDQLRVLDVRDRVADHAWKQDLALGQLGVLPDRPLPFVARVRRLDGVG